MKKKIINTIIVVGIYIALHSIFEENITKVIVNPIAQHVKSLWINNIIFLTVIGLMIGQTIQKAKRKFLLSENHIIINCLVIIFALYYRIENSTWNFTQLKDIPLLSYFDLAIVYSLSNLSLVFFQNKSKQQKSKGFYYDEPLGESSADLLNREKLAQYLAKKISETNSIKSAFTIGINGKWGTGKTSFFDLLKKSLNPEESIIINFNPWLSHSDKLMIHDFFASLSKSLSKYNSEFTSLIDNYLALLLEYDDSSKKIINTIKKFGQQNLVLSQFDKINSAIKKIDKEIIVFIDDIDRLDENEILEIVKVIRNSANFGNVVFIAAYDRDYLISALKKINNYGSEYYLEKIFQLEIPLPNYENAKIQQKLFELIKPELREEDKEEFEKIILNDRAIFEKEVISYKIISTLRDATRFANSFLISYSFLKGEVVLSDLLVIEQLRFKFPTLYNKIFTNPEDFLTEYPDGINKNYYSLIKEEVSTGTNVKEYTYKLKDFLIANNSQIVISNELIDEVISLLNGVFPASENFYLKNVEELSVANPDKFNIYSHYKLLDSDISEIEFSKYRSMPIEDFNKQITNWIEKGKRWDLKRKFENIKSFSSKHDFENIIIAVFHFANVPKITDNDFSGYDYQDLKNKIGSFKNVKHFYRTEEEYRVFILSLFKQAVEPYLFETEISFSIRNQFDESFIISLDELEKISIEYFKKHIEVCNEISWVTWHLYHYYDINIKINETSNSYQTQKIKNPKANSIFIENIKGKLLKSFLMWSIDTDIFHQMELFNVSGIVHQIFGNYQEYEKLLDTLKERDDDYIQEYLTFYNLCNQNNHKQYIKFDFKHIDLSERFNKQRE